LLTRNGCFSKIREGLPMLATIAAILIIFWVLGLVFHIAGGIIHILLVIGLIMLVMHFVRGRRAV